MAINNFDFEYLTIMRREVINVLGEFNIMISRDMVELDQGAGRKIDEYLHKLTSVGILN